MAETHGSLISLLMVVSNSGKTRGIILHINEQESQREAMPSWRWKWMARLQTSEIKRASLFCEELYRQVCGCMCLRFDVTYAVHSPAPRH